jgi:MprA protease rhombosortase-interaction domain-containing protein
MREQIVRLCEDYSIVSEYASFLVLENDAEYQRWAIDRKNSVRLGRDRAALEARRERLRELRDEALAKLGPQEAAPETAVQAAIPASTPRSFDVASTPAPMTTPSAPRNSSRSFDFGGGGGGGGAIDPLSGAVLLSLAGLGAWSTRRRSVA